MNRRRPHNAAAELAAAALLAALGCAAPAAPPAARPPAPAPSVELLASFELPTGHRFAGTEVGGLSALARDPATGDWLALSDDRGERAERGPVRLYRLRLLPGAGGEPLAGGVELIEVIGLTRFGAPPPPGDFDPEGLVVTADALWISSEGVAAFGVPPFVRRFDRDGAERAELPLPAAFVPSAFTPAGGGAAGVRDNLGFEGLALTPDGRWLIAGTESALAQDGPVADFGVPAVVRLVVWDLEDGEPAAQHLYPIDPVPWPPVEPDAFRINGLVEVLALDRHRLLVLERAFAVGRGTALRLYRVDLAGADNVSDVHSLAAREASGEPAPRPAEKTLLADVGELLAAAGVPPDNVEGMAFGPDLPDGRRLLLMVSDNNFSPLQRTLFLAFAVAPSSLR
jgi:hypothetical protein